jgi:Tol biopolymer transport system component
MSIILKTQSFNKSFFLLLLASMPLNGCENAAEPPQPALVHFAAVTPTNIAGVVGTEVTSIPVVRVTDREGNPLPAFRVSFRTKDGGLPGNVSVQTDNNGIATAGSWRLGPKAGNQTLQAFYNIAVPFGEASPTDTAVFTAAAEHGPLASVKAVDGVSQYALTGGRLSMPLRVRAVDSFDNPVPGVPVAFSVVTGNGTIDGANTTTGSDGEGSSGIWTLGPEPGLQDVRADAGSVHAVFRATACKPDECRMMFYRDSKIFAWDAGSVRQLTSDKVRGNVSRWSPDRKHIAFTGENGIGTGNAVFLMDADGSNVTRLLSGSYFGLAWSPDGNALALGNGDGFIEILDLTQEGGIPHKVADGYDPDWSPDGKQILFVTDGSAIRAMNADGTDVRELRRSENDAVSVSSPRWSPDGQRIAYTRYDASGADLYVMQANGSEVKRLTSDSQSFSPSWSPDGSRIAFTRTGYAPKFTSSIFYVDATGGQASLLIDSAYSPEWIR